jgi:8-oxo-dGTP pyrophosphatase MutT (NUDIX family)
MSRYQRELRGLIGSRLLLAPSVVAVVRDARGRVLLQQRTKSGKWNLPGGSIDPGEAPADAVVREVREETGLDVAPERVAGVFGGRAHRMRYDSGNEVEYTVVAFDCRVVGGALAGEPDETEAVAFVGPEEAARRLPQYPAALFAPADPRALFDAPGSGEAGRPRAS